MMEKYLKCPICNTVQPFEVDFCVYCNTPFDKEKVETIYKDDGEENAIQD